MVLLRFKKSKKCWDIINKKEKQEGDLYLDGELRKKLDFAKQQQKKNNDVVGILSGDEGSGKTALGGNIMRYMTDDKFNPEEDLIGAEDNEFVMDKLEKIPKAGGIMFDEGNTYFLSTETMRREQRELHKLFSIFRQKNLFVLIVAPSFFRLNTYFALDRSRFHIRTYIRKGERGFFAYFGDAKKQKLYGIGKKNHNYDATPPNFRGRFTKCYALETPEYISYKEKSLRDTFASFKKEKIKIPTEFMIKQKLIDELITNNQDIKTKEIASILNLTNQRVNQIKSKMKN